MKTVVVVSDLGKAFVREHYRRLRDGRLVRVSAHDDRRGRGGGKDMHTGNLFADHLRSSEPPVRFHMSEECARNPEDCTVDMFSGKTRREERLGKAALVVFDDPLLKATITKVITVPAYTKKDGTVVPAHTKTVHFDPEKAVSDVLSGQGSHSQKWAHKKLHAHVPGFKDLPEEHQLAHILSLATDYQNKQSQAAALSGYKQSILSGKVPTASQMEAWSALDEPKQVALLNELAKKIDGGFAALMPLHNAGVDKVQAKAGGAPVDYAKKAKDFVESNWSSILPLAQDKAMQYLAGASESSGIPLEALKNAYQAKAEQHALPEFSPDPNIIDWYHALEAGGVPSVSATAGTMHVSPAHLGEAMKHLAAKVGSEKLQSLLAQAKTEWDKDMAHHQAAEAFASGSHYQKEAHKKLVAEHGDAWHSLTGKEKHRLLQAKYQELQGAATASAKFSTWKKKVLAGQVPSASEAMIFLDDKWKDKAKATFQEAADKIGAEKVMALQAAALAKNNKNKQQVDGAGDAPKAEASLQVDHEKAVADAPAKTIKAGLNTYTLVDGAWKNADTGEAVSKWKQAVLNMASGLPVDLSDIPEEKKEFAVDYAADLKGLVPPHVALETFYPDAAVGDVKRVGDVSYIKLTYGWAKQDKQNKSDAPPKQDSASAQPASVTNVIKKPVSVPGVYFENTSNGHNKFWHVAVDGNKLITQYGKIGASGQSTIKEFFDEKSATEAMNKLIAQKKSKGYEGGKAVKLTYVKEVSVPVAGAGDGEAVSPVKSDVGPKEGDTKVENGVTYVLKNGRWHKQEGQDQAQAPAAKKQKLPAAVKKIEAVDAGTLSALLKGPLNMSPEIHAFADGLPTKSAQEYFLKRVPYVIDHLASDPLAKEFKTQRAVGRVLTAAFGFPNKIMLKDGTLVDGGLNKVPSSLIGLIETDPAKCKTLCMQAMLKKLGKDAAGAPVSAATPKSSSSASKQAPISNSAPVSHAGPALSKGGVASMSGWKQVGTQMGSNPGGVYLDKNGQKWYVKFPKDPDIARNEFLAAKFYQMLGVAVPNLKLVDQDGKLGIASKWVDGLNKGSAGDLANAKGAHDAFAIDAWLANWDVVGLGNDNMMLGKDGAVRVDAGGSLLYRAQGEKKGDAFGDEVVELDSLKDASKNSQAAAVFGGVTQDALMWGVNQLNKLKPSQIEELVEKVGPGSADEKKALAKKLIARRADILKKMGVRDQWEKRPIDETKLVVKAEDLPKPLDFTNWQGTGQGLSSSDFYNKQNTADSVALIEFAKQGNLTALKNYQYEAVDKATGKSLGKKPITEHPSKHIQEQWAGLVEMLQSIAYPPVESLQMPSLGAAGSIEDVSEMAGFFPVSERVETVAAEHRMHFFMKLSQLDDVSDLVSGVKWRFLKKSDDWVKKQYENFPKFSQAVRSYITHVQKSGWINHVWSQGKDTVTAGAFSGTPKDLAAKIYAEAVDIPEGTVLLRGMKDTSVGKSLSKQLLEAKPGLIIQNTDSMCASYNENHSWSGDIQMTIRCGPGCKATPSFASGKFSGEHEITTLPGQRFVVLSTKKVGATVHLEVLMLPPHEGFVADLGVKSPLKKAIVLITNWR